jgi:hypothetical protein
MDGMTVAQGGEWVWLNLGYLALSLPCRGMRTGIRGSSDYPASNKFAVGARAELLFAKYQTFWTASTKVREVVTEGLATSFANPIWT